MPDKTKRLKKIDASPFHPFQTPFQTIAPLNYGINHAD